MIEEHYGLSEAEVAKAIEASKEESEVEEPSPDESEEDDPCSDEESSGFSCTCGCCHWMIEDSDDDREGGMKRVHSPVKPGPETVGIATTPAPASAMPVMPTDAPNAERQAKRLRASAKA